MRKPLIFLLLASTLMARPYRYDPYAPFAEMFGAFWQWAVGSRAFLPPSGGLCGAFAHCYSLTYNSTLAGSANSSNFPALIYGSAPALKDIGHGGYVNSSGGADILFFSDPALTAQIGSTIATGGYDNVNGILHAWVNIATLSASVNGTIYLALGNAAPPARIALPWSNTFGLVNLYNPSGALDLTDYASGLTATNSGATSISGPVGGGASFSGSSEFYAIAHGMPIDNWTNLSVLMWANLSKATVQWGRLAEKGSNNEWELVINNTASTGIVSVSTGGAALNTGDISGAWHRLAFLTSSTGGSLYVDGSLVGSGTLGAPSVLTHNLNIGQYGGGGLYLTGSLANLQVSNSAATSVLSSSWVKADYNNQSTPGNIGAPGFWTWSLLQ